LTGLTLWGNLLPLLVFTFSAGLAVFARWKKWPLEISEPAAPAQPIEETRPWRERIKTFFVTNRWWLVLAAALALVFGFALVFAPPRLTGEIPPDPNMPGRPFYGLRWERAYLRDNLTALSNLTGILASLASLVPSLIAIRKRSRLHTEVALLLASLNLAILAQWIVSNKDGQGIGAAVYVVAALGLLYWTWLARPRLTRDLEPAPAPRGWELPLILILLALTAFGRFYALRYVPYGIEGDEAKWTSEAVNLNILGEPDTSGEYHRDALPVSFYLQTPFHRLLGASLLSARVAVALLSVLASLLFYWLLRQMTPVPVAALAAFLLAVSIFDISASRLANVESFVKIGAVLPLALLAYALRDKPWQAFGLAGIALALAALTYDTLWPIGIVCLVLVVVELWKQETPRKEKFKSVAALFAPVALLVPVLVPYFTSRVNYYELGQKGWDSGTLATFGSHFTGILQSWFVILRPDFLYNRVGPLINAALLPWLVVGVAASLLLVRLRSVRWLLVWVALVVFPVPILANSPLGRVYYPALPAVYGLIAIGLYLFWMEIQRISADWFKPVLVAAALVPLIWLPLTNYFIYFNEVSEPGDRQMRREISEIAASVASVDADTLMMLAVVPNADEPLNNEYQMIELFMLQHKRADQIEDSYRRVALDDVMTSITGEFANRKKIIVVLDKNSSGQREQRDFLKLGLIHCFPQGVLTEGNFFDRFILDEAARASSKCVPVKIELNAYFFPELQWKLSGGNASSLTLQCNRQRTNYQRIEAEEIPLGPGWQMQINFAPGWTGSGFLMDNLGSQFMFYEFDNAFVRSELYLWARTFKRVTNHSPVIITLGDQTLPLADTPEAALDAWTWERVGPFRNNGIAVRMTIARPYEEDPQHFMAIFIDTFILTDDPAFTPTSDLTDALTPQYFTVNGNAISGSIYPQLPPGQYSCRVELDSAQYLVDAFGKQPVVSNEIEFRVP
jgi:hypothetical protein